MPVEQRQLGDLTITGPSVELGAPTQGIDSRNVFAAALPGLFKMRGRDDGRAPGVDYIVWTFEGDSPDFAGTGFAGGDPTPIGSLVVDSVVKVVTLREP